MRSSPSILLASMAVVRCALFCALAICFCFPSLAQDTDINRYTLYTGFDYMISPARNLTERGFDLDFGVTVKPWMALGGDVSAIGDSVISGAGTINGSETVYAPAVSAVGLPPSAIHVPFRSTSYTFAVGPQFYWRRWKRNYVSWPPGFRGNSRVGKPESPTSARTPVYGARNSRSQCPPDRYDVVHRIGWRFRSQRQPSRGAALHCRLGEYAPVLRSTDEPAELREIHDWPDISLGPFLAEAGPRFSYKETGSIS